MGERLVRWMPHALVLALFGWVAVRAARPVSDPDDWWHLRLGNDLVDQHSLAAPHHWSAYATVPWVPTEPLPEIASAYVERWWGLPGLAVLYAVVGLLVVLTLHRVSRRFAAPLPAAVTCVLAVLAASASLTPRPQLVSFALLPVVVTAWLRTEEDQRVRWWLVPLVWVWALCHGFWFIGAGYGALFVAGFAVSRRMPLRVLVRQGVLVLATFLVVALSPIGLGVLKAPFAVNDTRPYIQEWERTQLTSPSAIGALLMVLVVVVTWLLTRHGVTVARVLVLVSAAFWIWYAARTVAVAGVVLVPLCAAALDRLVGTREEEDRSSRVELVGLTVAAVVIAAVVAVVAPSTSDRPGGVPTALDADLDRLPPGTGVFNDYGLGGWIAWRHPDLEQYVDGLVTPYSVAHVQGYALAVTTGPGWYAVVRASRAPVALVAAGSALATGLTGHGWTTVGTDAGWVLLREPG